MRTTTPETQTAWLSGDFTGSQRAMMRATVTPLQAKTYPHKTQVFCTTVWSQNAQPRELPNIKSIKWNRALDQDAATCTLVLYNTEPLPLGTQPSIDDDFDLPGYYTFNRGRTTWSTTRWNQEATGWHDQLVPDRIIRTYEGYGFDPTVIPENDPHMYLSGVWLIDTVEYGSDGLITVTCRDLARILMDQIMFVPVVPLKHYPISFTKYFTVDNPDITTTTGSTAWVHPTFSDSSTTPYVGLNGKVHGHRGSDAFDTSLSSYWLSTGNASPNADYSYEWVEGKIASGTVASVKFKVWGGPYRVYISIYSNGKWRGDHIIPYNADDPIASPNGANIRFISAFSVGDGVTKTYTFSNPWTKVTKIRLTFTHLYNSGIGPYVYRAGCRDFQVAVGETVSTTSDGGTHTEGNYADFSDIAKLILAYGGFYWPPGAKLATRRLTDGSVLTSPPPSDDPYLKSGRVWGDIMETGTAGIVPLDVQIFDKKPLLDCLTYIRDLVGFTLFIDETGGAVWRLPNVWSVGNIYGDGDPKAGRSTDVHEIDERTTLINLTATLSSHNVREKIFVANVAGRVGAVVPGFNPYPSGLRRVAGWCVDTETEIFTRRGWLRYDEVVAGDETLSLDQSGEAVWQPIREVAVFEPTDRQMTRITANNFDAFTTPDHRWPVETYSTITNSWNPEYRTSETLSRMSRLRRAAPGAAAASATIDDAIVDLVAWTYTEGTVRRKGNYVGITIYQSPVVNPENCVAIKRALIDAGASWRERTRKGCNEYALHAATSRLVAPHLDEDKAPTQQFLTSLTQAQLERFIDISVRADGHERLTGKTATVPSRFFYQNVGPRLDAFLAACALAGQATSFHVRSGDGNWHGSGDVATVTLLESAYASIGQMARTHEHYNDIVWCPAMSEHHNWLARRGGSVYYTGNTDQNFTRTAECRIMADMIAVRQMYSYRTDKVVIAGNPAMQMDDQVRIFERVTNEGYLHYISGIESDWDLETGKWTYTLSTNWLGVTPFSNWVIDPSKLGAETKAYLSALTGVPIG